MQKWKCKVQEEQKHQKASLHVGFGFHPLITSSTPHMWKLSSWLVLVTQTLNSGNISWENFTSDRKSRCNRCSNWAAERLTVFVPRLRLMWTQLICCCNLAAFCFYSPIVLTFVHSDSPPIEAWLRKTFKGYLVGLATRWTSASLILVTSFGFNVITVLQDLDGLDLNDLPNGCQVWSCLDVEYWVLNHQSIQGLFLQRQEQTDGTEYEVSGDTKQHKEVHSGFNRGRDNFLIELFKWPSRKVLLDVVCDCFQTPKDSKQRNNLGVKSPKFFEITAVICATSSLRVRSPKY